MRTEENELMKWLGVWFVLTCVAMVNMSIGEANVSKEATVLDFGREGAGEDWLVVNDGVMGGLSTSQIQLTDSGTAVFKGHLSLENNGGFASVRTLLDGLDLSEYEGLTLRARGDGREYQIRLRTDQRFDGVTYRATFATKRDQWTTVTIPFSEFKPTYRGRVLRGVEPLDTRRLQQLAFMVADKKEGSFQLELAWVKAFSSEGESR
jgi:monofunctional biosynthetic peptidoglycan transglycosylase